MRLPSSRVLTVVSAFSLALAGQVLAQEPNAAEALAKAEVVPGSLESAPRPTGYESDLYCFGYLGGLNDGFIASVTSASELAEQVDFATHDIVYIDAGADKGIQAGQEYWLVTPQDEVFSPVSGQSLGRFYQYRGRGVVLCIGGRSSTVRIIDSCTEVPLGAFLKKFEPIPIPLARKTPLCVACDPPSGKPQGRIVFSRDGLVALGQDTDVIVDLGIAHGLEPGDFLTIYRYSTGRTYGIEPWGTYWVNVPPAPGVEIPRTYLGEIAVLEVGDRWAIGRITDSYRLIEIGDEVELK